MAHGMTTCTIPSLIRHNSEPKCNTIVYIFLLTDHFKKMSCVDIHQSTFQSPHFRLCVLYQHLNIIYVVGISKYITKFFVNTQLHMVVTELPWAWEQIYGGGLYIKVRCLHLCHSKSLG